MNNKQKYDLGLFLTDFFLCMVPAGSVITWIACRIVQDYR